MIRVFLDMRMVGLFQPAASDNLFLSHCFIFHSFTVMCASPHLHVVVSTYVLSVQSVKAKTYLRPICGPQPRPLAVEARPETKRPAFASLSQMILLTDLTVSASPSPGRPPPPLAITTTHSSLS